MLNQDTPAIWIGRVLEANIGSSYRVSFQSGYQSKLSVQDKGVRERAKALNRWKAICISGMVVGMATAKLTITLEEEQLSEIHALVAAGKARSISGFVQHAVRVALFDAAGWREMLTEALQQTGGPLTKKERAWADALLTSGKPKRSSRRGKAA